MNDLIGERVKYLREKHKLSLRKLGMQAGVPVSTLHYLETGKRAGGDISVNTAKRLARVLAVSLDYLCVMYEEDMPSADA